MLKLRKILLHSTPYYLFLIIAILITILRLSLFPNHSTLKGTETKLEVVVDSYHLNSDKITLKVKYKKEFLLATYYFKTPKEQKNFLKHILFGRKIMLKGTLEKPQTNRVENGFSYQAYLKTEKIYYLMKTETIKLEKMTNSIYYHLKNILENKMKNKKSQAYLKTFILGNDENIKKEVKLSFRQNGISHLFAISGMHISLMSTTLLFLLKKLLVPEKKRYFLVSSFLFLYLILTFSPSVLRATIFFLLFSINSLAYFYIKPFHLFLLTLTICLLINPYFIYNIGFQYSFLISGVLILGGDYINEGKNMLDKTLKTSLLSFFASSIITLNHFYELNFLSIFYNLIYVPFISYLVFPLSILTFFCPLLDQPLYLLIKLLEKTSLFFNNITIGKIILGKPTIVLTICYCLTLLLFLKMQKKKKKAYYVLFLPLFVIHLLLPVLNQESYILMLDIGQGDSILLHSKNKTILVDTGGISTFSKKNFPVREKTKITEQITIPYLKSKGIRKIDVLVLTHGDYDHLGEAKYLVDNFNVENIIINSGKINDLEEELIKNQKNVIKGYEGLKISCGNFELIQLNEEYQDENASSQIYYVTNGSISILLTGDAPTESERNLIKKYDLPEIDILKVGHHGSKTSSSKEFINTIKPKYSLISCGKDNKFGHPNKEVLDNLGDSIIYRTDIDGSIMFKIKKDKLDIKTCPP